MAKLKEGDLATIYIVEHASDPKKYLIEGKFKGIKKPLILARVGEGSEDPRSEDTIKQTAEYVAKEIRDTYALNAFVRRNEK